MQLEESANNNKNLFTKIILDSSISHPHPHMNGTAAVISNHIGLNMKSKTKALHNGVSSLSIGSSNHVHLQDDPGGGGGAGSNVNGDLCTSLRMFLRFGRLLGIIPLDGLFSRNVTTETLRFSRWSIASLSNKLIILMLSINVCIGLFNLFLSKKETASELAFSSAMAFFYFMGAFTYAYFGKYSNELLELFKIWKHMKKLYFSPHAHTTQPNETDPTLFRDTNLVAGLIFTSAILENMLLFCLQSQIIFFPFESHTRVAAPLMDIYYHKSHTEWTRVVHNQTNSTPAPFLGYFVFFSNKFALYAWNYADTAIIIFSRALYYKFAILNKVAESQLLAHAQGETSVIYSTVPQWKQLTIDHATLCQLLNEFEVFLSPLVFTCFATNTFFICLQIKLGLTSTTNTNMISSMYYVWSLLHLLARVYMVSLSASRINDYAQGVQKLYQACPTNTYTLEVQRADHFVASTKIGLTGLGCFIITKPFILTVVGVVFTLEIVLLQTVQ